MWSTWAWKDQLSVVGPAVLLAAAVFVVALGVDDVIDPADMRAHLTAALDMACGKLRRAPGRKTPLFP